MPDLDERDVLLPGPQRLEQAVDAVAGKSKDGVDSPGDETVDE